MGKQHVFKSAVLALALSSTAAQADNLTNGSGDGKVSVSVTPAGAFGSSSPSPGGNATYNPIGPIGPASTTFESYVYFRLGDSGVRTNLSTLPATVTSSSANSLTSTFSIGGLNFTLTQTLADLLNAGTQTGSLLTQTYNITNTTNAPLSFELLRYIDGDLLFDGSLVDGGGRLLSGGREILFETDSATGSADSATFLGIYNEGGTPNGYEIDSYSGLRGRIQNGTALDNLITGDGGDSDQFIDAGNGYDVTLGLSRLFTLLAGGSTTFTTGTIFGTGAPQDIVLPPTNGAVPEPATWAMMLLGFYGIGVAVRRKRTPALARA
jgi:hypothetical protein